MTTETTLFEALHYWQQVTANAHLFVGNDRLAKSSDLARSKTIELAERGLANCHALLRSIEYNQPGGLREHMTVALVNHGQDVDFWADIPQAVRWTLEQDTNAKHGKLSDCFSLHS